MHKVQSKCNSCGSTVNSLLIGTAIGGLIGAGTALLLAPKSGKALRKSICTTYDDLAEKFEDTKDELLDQGEELLNTAQSWKNSGTLAGGITGALLVGAITAFILAYNSKGSQKKYRQFTDKATEFIEHLKENSHLLNDTFKGKAENWIDNANVFLKAIQGALQENYEKVDETTSAASQKVNDILQFADLGIRLLQNFSKRR